MADPLGKTRLFIQSEHILYSINRNTFCIYDISSICTRNIFCLYGIYSMCLSVESGRGTYSVYTEYILKTRYMFYVHGMYSIYTQHVPYPRNIFYTHTTCTGRFVEKICRVWNNTVMTEFKAICEYLYSTSSFNGFSNSYGFSHTLIESLESTTHFRRSLIATSNFGSAEHVLNVSWRDTTYPYVEHDSSHVWHSASICVTWRVHMCDMTHSYVFRDAFICVTWLHRCVTWLIRTQMSAIRRTRWKHHGS